MTIFCLLSLQRKYTVALNSQCLISLLVKPLVRYTHRRASSSQQKERTRVGVVEMFVATDGSDSDGDGTIARPFMTIARAQVHPMFHLRGVFLLRKHVNSGCV